MTVSLLALCFANRFFISRAQLSCIPTYHNGAPPFDATQHRHCLENIVQRHLLGESQKPSGQWAHSWLQESLMVLFWSKKLRRQLVASGLDRAAGEIGIKVLAEQSSPSLMTFISDLLSSHHRVLTQKQTEAASSLLA